MEFRCASPEGDAASNRIPTQPFLGEMCDGFGKVGLITGGGGGIGRASSLGCARRGAKVVVDLDPAQGEASAELVRQQSGNARFLHADVT